MRWYLVTFPSDNDDRLYEVLSNALIRRTVFMFLLQVQ